MFVSKARHDRELAALERLLAHAEDRLAGALAETSQAMRLHELERRRYDELLQQFMALKVKGAEVVPVAGGLVEPHVVPPDPLAHLKALIGEKCGRNYDLRGKMLRQLTGDHAAGVPHHIIEQRILSGVPTDGVPA